MAECMVWPVCSSEHENRRELDLGFVALLVGKKNVPRILIK